ncbi:MAG: acyl-CoA dehydrogenase family protein [Leptospiraceae bacterium]|nr:acyl-CoA dehydrogenase family protein [Leptospiraceae bacterium]
MNSDLQFVLDHFVDWDTIIPLRENGFADAAEYRRTGDKRLEFAPSSVAEALENYRAVWLQTGELAGKEVAPAARAMERHGLKFENGKVIFPPDTLRLVDLFSQSGILAYSMNRRHGGLGMGLTASSVVLELVSQADPAFGITIGCFNLAEVIERFGSEKMIEEWVPKMAAGEVTGAMALTEPNYGSDLSHITTRAVKGEDGIWRLTGTKRFITHGCGVGDRPSVILTLARSGGAGAKGLSFFLVPSTEVQVARIEEKLGLHTSPTCEIVYENSKAELIGKEGMGLVRYAMDMMNGARMGIAVQSLGIAQAAHNEATKYASERVQFGDTINKLPAIKRILQDNEALVQGMRALVYRACQIVDHYDGLAQKLLKETGDERAVRKNEEVVRLDRLAKLLTPTAKLFCSEEANFVAYHSLQVFGGSGYTEEYDIAKIYRDARICTIYEGTTQLQAVAAIGGIVEGLREGGFLLEHLRTEIAKIRDTKIQNALTQDTEKLTALVPRYKELPEKEAFSIDMVAAFARVYISILLAQQMEIALAKNLAIAENKSRVFRHFHGMSRRYLSGLAAQLELAA